MGSERGVFVSPRYSLHTGAGGGSLHAGQHTQTLANKLTGGRHGGGQRTSPPGCDGPATPPSLAAGAQSGGWLGVDLKGSYCFVLSEWGGSDPPVQKFLTLKNAPKSHFFLNNRTKHTQNFQLPLRKAPDFFWWGPKPSSPLGLKGGGWSGPPAQNQRSPNTLGRGTNKRKAAAGDLSFAQSHSPV